MTRWIMFARGRLAAAAVTTTMLLACGPRSVSTSQAADGAATSGETADDDLDEPESGASGLSQSDTGVSDGSEEAGADETASEEVVVDPRIMLRILGSDIGDEIGRRLVNLGDVNGDGRHDLATTRGGRILVVYGGLQGDFEVDSVLRKGAGFEIATAGWWDIVGADVDGDGTNELVVATGSRDEPEAAVAVIEGSPETTVVDVADASYPKWSSASFWSEAYPPVQGALSRSGFIRAGDVSGDGFDDLIIAGNSSLLVLIGPLGPHVGIEFDTLLRSGVAVGLGVVDFSHYAPRGLLDVDDDGFNDIVAETQGVLLQMPGPVGRLASGSGDCIPGGDSSTTALVEMPYLWYGGVGPHYYDEYPSWAPLGDAAAFEADVEHIWGVPNMAMVLLLAGAQAGCGVGPRAIQFQAATPGPAEKDPKGRFGHAVAGLEDCNGDGVAEFLVGDPGDDGDAGRVWLVLGDRELPWQDEWVSPDGTYHDVRDLQDSGRALNVEGDEAGWQFGAAVASGRFFDDAARSFAVGGPGASLGPDQSGVVIVYDAAAR